LQKATKLYWITGLAGAGKSTTARALCTILRERGIPVILFDGDEVREALQMTGRYTSKDREWLANSYAKLGQLVTKQGIHVVCATISPFPTVRAWLRANVAGYVEVYVRATIETVNQRDQKKLYSRSSRAEVSHVVGYDIPFVPPERPDIIVDSDTGFSPTSIASMIADFASTVSC
jgi:cytidine diphosphoramidate kinase